MFPAQGTIRRRIESCTPRHPYWCSWLAHGPRRNRVIPQRRKIRRSPSRQRASEKPSLGFDHSARSWSRRKTCSAVRTSLGRYVGTGWQVNQWFMASCMVGLRVYFIRVYIDTLDNLPCFFTDSRYLHEERSSISLAALYFA